MAEDGERNEGDCAFQWDEDSQLYYHASTGFYHDPQAGWYYSSTDGLYYKFEDGNYVPFESNQDQTEMDNINSQTEVKEVQVDPSLDSPTLASSDQSDFPPPPSEWLEDTLIDMYLSGYSNQTNYAADSDTTMDVTTNGVDEINGDDIEELEEGEWVPDDPGFWRNFSDKILAEGVTEEEENWRAQYGQVIQLDKEWITDLQTVNLWDWGLVRGKKKDGKTEVSRLVGRLRKPASKLHPSVSSGGGIFKTAPVCEAHLDIVRVTSGRIYRLKSPSLQYLASLSVYDAYNPTKDWGFPQLSIKDTDKLPKDDQLSKSQISEVFAVQNEKSLPPVKLCSSKMDNVYRDRAAERRALHGGFGVGPGQKNTFVGPDSAMSSPTLQPEEAAAESMNISFGEGSYARKILQGMGWKEGETLGLSMKGLSEPLQASGNKGTAGLGWDNGWTK